MSSLNRVSTPPVYSEHRIEGDSDHIWDSASETWKSTNPSISDSEDGHLGNSAALHKEGEKFVDISLNEPAQKKGNLTIKKDKTSMVRQIGTALKEGLRDTMLYRTGNLICGLCKVMFTKAKLSETFDTRPFTAKDIVQGEREMTTVATISTCIHHMKKLFAKKVADEQIDGIFSHVLLGLDVEQAEAPSDFSTLVGKVSHPSEVAGTLPRLSDFIEKKHAKMPAAPKDSSPLTLSEPEFEDVDLL